MLSIVTEQNEKKILVIGVGGAGNRIVSKMADEKVCGVELIGVNTDAEELARCKAPTLVDIGEKFRGRFSVGGYGTLGILAAEENRERLTDMVKYAGMVIIICGMGGQMGTGAAPMIAKIAKEQGILTIGVATQPSEFETHGRMRDAMINMDYFKENVDSLIVIPNDNLLRLAGKRAAFPEIMEKLDETLVQVVRGITDPITLPMLVSLDFMDLSTVMKNKGFARVGIGSAESIDGALENAIVRCQLTRKNTIFLTGDARHVIVTVSGNVSLSDFETVTEFIEEFVGVDTDIFVALDYDGSIDGVRAAVIATGFSNMTWDDVLK